MDLNGDRIIPIHWAGWTTIFQLQLQTLIEYQLGNHFHPSYAFNWIPNNKPRGFSKKFEVYIGGRKNYSPNYLPKTKGYIREWWSILDRIFD